MRFGLVFLDPHLKWEMASPRARTLGRCRAERFAGQRYSGVHVPVLSGSISLQPRGWQEPRPRCRLCTELCLTPGGMRGAGCRWDGASWAAALPLGLPSPGLFRRQVWSAVPRHGRAQAEHSGHLQPSARLPSSSSLLAGLSWEQFQVMAKAA